MCDLSFLSREGRAFFLWARVSWRLRAAVGANEEHLSELQTYRDGKGCAKIHTCVALIDHRFGLSLHRVRNCLKTQSTGFFCGCVATASL